MMCELYERDYRKFGYTWKIMTLNQKKKKKKPHARVMKLVYI